MSTDVQNAIFASSKAGYEDDIKELLANPKVDWKAKDGLGNTPLHYAAGAGHTGVVKLLLDSKKIDINVQNNSGDTAAHKAAGKGHLAVAKLLVAAGINLTAKNADHKWAKDLAHNGDLKAVLEPVVEIPGLGSDDEEENKSEEEEDEDEEDDG